MEKYINTSIVRKSEKKIKKKYKMPYFKFVDNMKNVNISHFVDHVIISINFKNSSLGYTFWK